MADLENNTNDHGTVRPAAGFRFAATAENPSVPASSASSATKNAGFKVKPPEGSGAGYRIKSPEFDASAGFEAAGKPKSFMRRHWWKALLLIPASYLAWNTAEGIYYTSQTDHPDEYLLSGVPGYVYEETIYDAGDVYLFAKSFFESEPDIVGDRDFIPEWQSNDELKVLFLRPRYKDDRFNEVTPTERYNRIFDFQKEYVMDAIREGSKGTRLGNAAAHGRHITVELVSERHVLQDMSPRQRSALDDLTEEQQLHAIARHAVKMMDTSQTMDYQNQKNHERHLYSARYVPAFNK